MPENTDDIDARVRVLEREVERLRDLMSVASADAAAARVLAGGADRDVSEVRAELRAHTRALNALRETQLEQGAAILGLRAETAALRADVTELRTDVTGLYSETSSLRTEMHGGFATMHTGMAQIVTLLEGLGGSGTG